MKKALAFDIGGTKIYCGTVDETGKMVSEAVKFPTPKNLKDIENLLREQITKYENEADVVAISTAGTVNNENTRVTGSTGNLPEGYYTIDFRNLSTKKVFLENDANAAAWAEYKIGASRGSRVSIMLTLGTGVGGGIIIDGKLFKGKSGAAGEMHFKMYPDKRRRCTCGSWDCFEIYTSGTALKLDAEEVLNSPDVTTYDIIDGVKQGDKKMSEVYNRWINDITIGLGGLANLFDPDCIVLSGSMAQFADIGKIEENMNADILSPPVSIRLASAGNFAGMIGAALLALKDSGINYGVHNG